MILKNRVHGRFPSTAFQNGLLNTMQGIEPSKHVFMLTYIYVH